jgi:indolepyruvate ferredoxin oxidoreductase
VEFLTAYQNAAYAAQYRAFVDKVRAEARRLGRTRLTEAVARYLFKLMAYKDEYEVARLHTDPAFTQKIAPCSRATTSSCTTWRRPLAKKDDRAELRKKPMAPGCARPWAVLAGMKGLRGTALDPFGRTEERRPSAP